MPKPKHDPGLDVLLALDGVVLVLDPNGAHWVKMVVKQVAPSPERPHGVSYSLTLHAANGERLVATTMRTPSAREPAQGGEHARPTTIATGAARQGPTPSATRRR